MSLCLGIGEVMVELGPTGSDDLLRRGFAGDVFNALYYARMLMPEAWRVAFHTGLGTDQLSDDMVDFIKGQRIELDDIPRIENRTAGLYLIQLQNGERSFSYWRNMSAARLMLREPDLLASKLAAASYVYLSGITLAILSPDDRALLLEMVREVKEGGATVFFDSNIRPKLWQNAREMRAAITAAGQIATIVLPSLDDEVAAFQNTGTTGTDPNLGAEAVATRYLGLGVSTVIVKNGGGPALVADGQATRLIAPPTIVEMVDSTAAGDAFNGAFMAALAAGKDIDSAVVAAHQCAAHVVGHHGALVPLT